MLALVSFAQEKNYYADEFPEFSANEDNFKSDINKNKLFNPDKFNFRLTTGTSFMNFYGNNIMSSYVMPEFGYKINDKFTLSTGIIANVNYG